MYANDTVLFTHARTKELVANKQSFAMVKVSNRLNGSCLSINASKTVCTYFTARKQNSVNPDIIFNGEEIKFVTHVKYLGIIIDHLSFKKQVKRVINNVKFNLNNIKSTLILPHLSYCITSWSQADATTLNPVYPLHQQIMKVLDKIPRVYHHCTILKRLYFLNRNNFVFTDVCMM